MQADSPDYNEILAQVSASLDNALNTFGPDSPQYQAILEILKDCLRNIGRDREKQTPPSVDPDTLSMAMGFLEIGK